MYNDKVKKAVRTITEYSLLRSKYRRGEFKRFDVSMSDGCLKLSNDDLEIIFLKKLNLKTYRILSSSQNWCNTIVVYETKMLVDNSDLKLFSLDELQYNIFNNNMVPELNFLTKQQEDELISYYGLKFPILNKNDKVCKYLGCKKGELVCFKRKNDSLYIRIVVD